MKCLGYLRFQHLKQVVWSPKDQSDDMDFVEKNATVFAELIQFLVDSKFVFSNERCKRQWKKGTLRDFYLSKGKLKVISLYTELTSLRRWESESITDYIIRTENISNPLKEAGEVISKRLLIAIVLKGLSPNFKLFTMVITQKKTLTVSESNVFLRSYEEREYMCYPPDESNYILQMKTTF